VISNKAAARGLERARTNGIPAVVIDHRHFASRDDFDRALLASLQTHEVELVICAGSCGCSRRDVRRFAIAS